MFQTGNYVVNAKNGVCEITDIVTMNMSGSNKDYYQLVPVEEQTAKIYIPVDNAENRIRPAMTKEQAEAFIRSVKDMEVVYLENEKEREKTYKEAINSRDPKLLVGIIKTLYLRKKQRLEAGKKNTTVDERYFKLAEHHLYSELSFALGVEKQKVLSLIVENL